MMIAARRKDFFFDRQMNIFLTTDKKFLLHSGRVGGETGDDNPCTNLYWGETGGKFLIRIRRQCQFFDVAAIKPAWVSENAILIGNGCVLTWKRSDRQDDAKIATGARSNDKFIYDV